MIIQKVFWIVLGIFFFASCGTNSSPQEESEAKAVYNQAYQETYEPDSLSQIIDEARAAYVLVDPFREGVVAKIKEIKGSGNELAGYISIGTGESFRDDFSELEPYLTTKAWEAWSDEFFVSETTTGIVEVMKKRIDKMATWKLDWVEFDNMDWIEDSELRATYSIKATEEEGKSYVNTLCDYTHSKGMKCMAKNTVDDFSNFDGVLYESFTNNKNWWDKEGTKSFLAQNKLVIINHYNEKDCDGVYAFYKSYYRSKKLSFICEDQSLQGYRHYNNK